jgi:hypothetical protein
MNNLYIRIQNGTITDHPVTESNLLKVFGQIPNDYIEFRRIPKPTTAVNEIAEHNGYIYSDVNCVQDYWVIKPNENVVTDDTVIDDTDPEDEIV